jgi:DNA modification methylase
MTENVLYYGDNLEVLRRHVKDESVDLVYLDPPFNSSQDYNVLFAEHDGARSAAQIQAFEDTWRWDQGAAEAYEQAVESGGRVAEAMRAFRTLLGESDMMAYLAMMAPRLVELGRVLKPTGSIYLHCDPTASHYLKMLMDSIFGPQQFRNELIWQRTSAHNDPSRYGRIHDVLLFYVKGKPYVWNQEYEQQDENYFGAHDFDTDERGLRYRKRDLTAPGHGSKSGQYEWKGKTPPSGRMWSYTRENMAALEAEGRIVYTKTGMPRLKIYVDNLKGVPYQDVWARPELWLNSAAGERLGYPTQKPEALLERIIKSSSNETDIVLDPFCGCGTAIAAAKKLNRRWIGIDITHLAIALIKHRLKDSFGDEAAKTYRVIGEPVSLPDAQQLAADDPYQFQWWALGLVGARPVEQKKGADKGIDGRLYFHDVPGGKTKQIILSVKAGHVTVSHLRDLRGVLDREKAEIGVLLCMEEPTRPMRTEAVGAGFYKTPYGNHAKLQILTVGQLLDGARIDYPPQYAREDRTFKKAPKAKRADYEQKSLPMAAESEAEYGE